MNKIEFSKEFIEKYGKELDNIPNYAREAFNSGEAKLKTNKVFTLETCLCDNRSYVFFQVWYKDSKYIEHNFKVPANTDAEEFIEDFEKEIK